MHDVHGITLTTGGRVFIAGYASIREAQNAISVAWSTPDDSDLVTYDDERDAMTENTLGKRAAINPAHVVGIFHTREAE